MVRVVDMKTRSVLWCMAGVALGAVLISLSQPAQAISGGPDACGYYYVDSQSAGGPAFDFVDISSTGTAGPAGDDVSLSVELGGLPQPLGPGPWSFDYCGALATAVLLSSNGYLCFDANPCTSYSPQTIPAGASSAPRNFVSGYWHDLNAASCACTRYQIMGTTPNRVFIYAMYNIPYYSPSDMSPGTFQIKLFEADASIEVHYLNMAANKPFPSVAIGGLQVNGGTTGLTWKESSSNSEWTFSSLAVRYYRGAPPPINQPPVATAQTVTLNEDCTATVSTSGCSSPPTIVLSGSDPDPGDPRYFCVQTTPTKGTLLMAPPTCPTMTAIPGPTYNVQYRPNNDYCNGAPFTPGTNDSFTFKVKDAVATSSAATVSLQVTCIADAPLAVADTYNLFENCSATLVASCAVATPPYFAAGPLCSGGPLGLKCNAAETDRDDQQVPAPSPTHTAQATVVLVAGPASGTLWKSDGSGPSPALSPDGGFRYVPNTDFCGTDSFTYKLQDDNVPTGLPAPAYSNTVTVTLNVACVTTLPVSGDDLYSAAAGFKMNTLARGAPSLLANDADPEGDALTPQICTGPTVGTLDIVEGSPLSPIGHFIYNAPAGFVGPATFTYKAVDADDNGSPCATVTIDVGPDKPPVGQFMASPTSPAVGQPVLFTDQSSDPDDGDFLIAWAWQFGDGGGASQASPTHVYTSAGSFKACVTPTDSYGVPGSPGCRTITVSPPPPAPSGASGGGSGSGTGAGSGGGPGTGSGSGGPQPDLDVAVQGPSHAMAGDLVRLHAVAEGAPTATFQWTQLSGPAVALEGAKTSDVSFVAPAAQGGAVYLQVVATGGGRTGQAVAAVLVDNDAAGLAVTVTGPAEVAAGEAVTLAAAVPGADGTAGDGPVTFAWTQVAGPELAGLAPAGAELAFTPDEAGAYAFLVTATQGERSGSAAHAVLVGDDAAGSAGEGGGTAPGFTIEDLGDGRVRLTPLVAAASYTWGFGDGQEATSDGTVTHAYGAAGQYTIRMTAGPTASAAPFERTATVAWTPVAESASRDAAAGGSGTVLWLVGGAVAVALAGALLLVLALRRRAA